MTTVIGLRAEKGKEKGIVLASDVSLTRTEWRPAGDVVYREQTKDEGQKMYISDDGRVAVAVIGTFDDYTADMLSLIRRGEIDLKKAFTDRDLKNIREMHMRRYNFTRSNGDDTTSLIIASRLEGKPFLHYVNPFGKVEERKYALDGSGSKHAVEALRPDWADIPYHLNMKQAFDICVEGLGRSSKDIYSGGLDIVAVTPDGIRQFGSGIKDKLDKAKKEAIRDIRRQL